MNKSSRETALDILLDIEKNNRFSNAAISESLRANQFMSKRDRAFITKLASGVTEQRIRLDYIINIFSKTKINKCKPLIRCVLRMGVYEIFYMDSVPCEVSCNEYVALTAKRGFKNLKGFVNGVLRNICRNKDEIAFPKKEEDVKKYLSVKYSVPENLIELLAEDYELKDLEIIFGAGNKDNGTTIRVNTEKISVEELSNKLQSHGIKVEKGKYNKTSLIISEYDYIRSVPGFLEGEFTVQDESSSLEVLAAGIRQGDLVVDVCAAPGGKTLYAAELTGNTGRVIARDISEEKIELIKENLERLDISNVSCEVLDACNTDEALVEKADVLIADLPCSGLGVMHRKNDIKYHVSRESVEELSALQKKILDASAAYVKPGGVLIYSTCTITGKENEKNAAWFLDNHKDFFLEGMDELLPDGLKERAKKGYLTLLQGFDMCDGFFISRFKKRI